MWPVQVGGQVSGQVGVPPHTIQHQPYHARVGMGGGNIYYQTLTHCCPCSCITCLHPHCVSTALIVIPIISPFHQRSISRFLSLILWSPLLPYGYSYTVVICNFWHPGTLTLSPEGQSVRMSKITNHGLTRSSTGCFIAAPIWQQWASNG